MPDSGGHVFVCVAEQGAAVRRASDGRHHPVLPPPLVLSARTSSYQTPHPMHVLAAAHTTRNSPSQLMSVLPSPVIASRSHRLATTSFRLYPPSGSHLLPAVTQAGSTAWRRRCSRMSRGLPTRSDP
eukprot:1851464-Rhodomonas_salina.3